jgi:hypothetical protein
VEENVHYCNYCMILDRQKQDCLEKGESVKDMMDIDSSDEEEDAEEILVPNEIKLIPSLLRNDDPSVADRRGVFPCP